MRKVNKTYLSIAAVLFAVCAAAVLLLQRFAPVYTWPAVAVCGVFAVALTIAAVLPHQWLSRCVQMYANRLDTKNRDVLRAFPLPSVMLSDSGEILFHNELFLSQVVGGDKDVVGCMIQELCSGLSVQELDKHSVLDIQCGEKKLTVYASPVPAEDGGGYMLYFCDNTSLKNIAAEYTATRPVVLYLCIDNLEEATRDLRDGDRARICGQVETLLEDWLSAYDGVLQKSGADRFVAVTVNKHLTTMTKNRFEILDTIRKAFPETDGGITLSVGVGQGKTLNECSQMARGALEMALGRGGDQVAIKTVNGYDFYGGQSRGVERRTKVRTRMVANSLLELIRGSEQVMIMGHRLSDLDCLGSGAALAVLARGLGKPAYVVVRSAATMAGQIIRRYQEAGIKDLFVEPEEAVERVGNNMLLIVTDTHSISMLEAPDFYESAARVVVIDHHRRMVNYIQDAVLTYHEPSSSSACELVAELIPYMTQDKPGRMEAEALLSGIMLDTRNFVMRTGVRTFEAAAYLRGLGADTVSVKKMFAESLDMYRLKNDLVAQAKLYKQTAITSSTENLSNRRAAAAQAADDLLSVHGVRASFVLCPIGREINISARSFGEINVQLIMESLGGGGHQTMAATQLPDLTVQEVEKQLKKAIDAYLAENETD